MTCELEWGGVGGLSRGGGGSRSVRLGRCQLAGRCWRDTWKATGVFWEIYGKAVMGECGGGWFTPTFGDNHGIDTAYSTFRQLAYLGTTLEFLAFVLFWR